MTDPLARLDAVVRGRVQGVGFRIFVAREAVALGLVGWVANEPDGSVRTVAEGSTPDLEAFLARLEAGSSGAWVEGVRATWGPGTGGLDRFEIRAGWHAGD